MGSREKEPSITGRIEAFRQRQIRNKSLSWEQSTRAYEEKVKHAGNLRAQMCDLIRAHVLAPNIIESDIMSWPAPDRGVNLKVSIPMGTGDVIVEISSNEYPFILLQKEADMKNPILTDRAINERLDNIEYGIDVYELDHRVSLGRSEATIVSKLIADNYGRVRCTAIDRGFTASKLPFEMKDYLIYEALFRKIADPKVRFEGHARDIHEYIPAPRNSHYAVRPAEIGQV